MILTILGVRPQFIKAAVVSKALLEAGIEEKVVHTGQHNNDALSGVFWKELALPEIHANLEVGGATPAQQIAAIIEKTEKLILELNPRAVMVYGDANSTAGAAIAASRVPGVKLIHVESGVRAFNRDVPEEVNRIITDHLSHILFCSSPKSVAQLANEGITDSVFDVGDVMHDCIKTFIPVAQKRELDPELQKLIADPFILMTVHRPENKNNPKNLAAILLAVKQIGKKTIWPTTQEDSVFENVSIPDNLHIIKPASYFEMLQLVSNCESAMTDSGGVQKETYWMQKPCITLREETEWIETLENGANQLTGANTNKILQAYENRTKAKWDPTLYGDGNAARKIANIIREKILAV